MLEKIRQLVKELADEEDWKYHIVPVTNFAKQLAIMLNVNPETAELAALLHDIGRLKFGGENHDVTGVPEAEKILKEQNCPQEIIDEVKHCISAHRGSKENPPKTTIAKIIANADAMAHFDVVPTYFFRLSDKSTFEESYNWVNNKIERDWNNKLTIPEARKMMEEKYKAIRLILDTAKKYI